MNLPLCFDQEPVTAWRAWALVDDGSGPALASVVYRELWPAREPLRRACEPGGCQAARWPKLAHDCGIHAFKRRADAEAFPGSWERLRFSGPEDPEEYVIGQVSLWGRVVEHEAGYRGELAYPYALLLSPGQERFASRLASAYAVDVAVDRPR